MKFKYLFDKSFVNLVLICAYIVCIPFLNGIDTYTLMSHDKQYVARRLATVS